MLKTCAGTDAGRIAEEARAMMNYKNKKGEIPCGDGKVSGAQTG